MTASDKHRKFLKYAAVIAVCVAVTVCAVAGSVKSTLAYITSDPVTCVNVFSADGSVKPTEPTDPITPTEPSSETGTDPSSESTETETTKESTEKPTETTESRTTEPTQTSDHGTTEPSGTDDRKAKTGDDFSILPWIIMAAASIIVMISTLVSRRSKN